MLFIGSELFGYLGGTFGRDCPHGSKRVEAVGADWLVLRTEGGPLFATMPANQTTQKWHAELQAQSDEEKFQHGW